jgi:Fur family peroxide stress response transcriptional regulator
MADIQARLEQWADELRARGCRLTPQRMAVLRALLTDSGHPTVQQVYERIRPDLPMISLATVYSTVALLKDIGAVFEINLGDEGSRYDGAAPYPHPHLICVRCKEIVDLEPAGLTELPLAVAQRTGYQIIGHRVDFFGICPRCQASTWLVRGDENPSEEGEETC